MTDLDKLARGLTKAQRRALQRGRFPDHCAYNREHPVFSAMERKGFLLFRHIIAGKGDFCLTPLGLALKAHIEKTERNG